MRRYRINGANRDSGVDVTVEVHADDEDHAMRLAREKRILVSSVNVLRAPKVHRRRLRLFVVCSMLLVPIFGGVCWWHFYQPHPSRNAPPITSIPPTPITIQKDRLHVDVRLREDKTGQLVPPSDATLYLIEEDRFSDANNVVSRYISALKGPLEVMATTNADWIASKLLVEQKSVRSPEIDRLLEEGAIKAEKARSIFVETWHLEQDRLARELKELSKITTSLGSSGSAVSEVPRGSYGVIAFGRGSLYVWRKPVKVSGNTKLFLGPEDASSP